MENVTVETNTQQQNQCNSNMTENIEITSKDNRIQNDRNDIQKTANEEILKKENKQNSDTSENNQANDEAKSEVQVKTSGNKDEEEQNLDVEVGSDEWFQEDQKKFKNKYPDLNSEELFSDPIFLEFAEKRAGVESMVDIYDTYMSISRRIEAKVMEKAEKEFKIRLANAKASPGSLTDSTKVADRLYSFDELKRMSPEAIERNWEKVQKSIKTFGK